MQVYKCEEWQGASGRWYVNDCSDICANTGAWWHPMRICELTPEAFIAMLHQYKAIDLEFDRILTYSFATQADARKYKNYINKMARLKNYLVGN